MNDIEFLESLNKQMIEKIFKYQAEITEKYKKLIEQEKIAQQKKKLALLKGKGEIKNGKDHTRRI